jgi:hypothetical protein
VKDGAAKANAHDAKIWDVSEEGIFAAPVLVYSMDSI